MSKAGMNIFEQQIKTSRKHIPAIQQALLETYFSNYDQEFLKTDSGKNDIENNVFNRYADSLRHVVPWLNRHITLQGKKVLEIGCGTGSSTAALAHYVHAIEGYDIHSLAVQGARKRLEIMELDNVRLHIISEDSLIKRIIEDVDGKYDIILLFAVLEHQTINERHKTLATCWDLLAEDGIMAVVDTPNLLHYFDLHTSKLPFLHMLPNRLYARYAANSPRSAFKASFSNEKEISDDHLDQKIARWGRGTSFHDFELVLGQNYKDYIAAEGFEPEILEWFPCTPEEEILRWYVQLKEFNIPLGFTRCVLNLIFKKYKNIHHSPPQTIHPKPPPIQHFSTDPAKKVAVLEQQLRDKNILIEKIYKSWTWRIGRVIAFPSRMLHKLIKR